MTYMLEWCAGCPLDKHGDAELDRADYRVELCRNRKEAVARALKLLPRDFFGAVRIQPLTLITPKEFRNSDEDVIELEGRFYLCGPFEEITGPEQ